MKIQEIFTKDLSRKINGVVKAEQRDPAVIWQELDEFVVTRELSKHLNDFFNTYLEFLDHPDDLAATSRNGVWISGFFGSGKSHFLKILSYLLENFEAHNPASGLKKKAIDFLEKKIQDALLFNTIKRTINYGSDAILFNIDSKADVHEDAQAQLLSVFTKVFNELQGFCGQYPCVAELEFQLQRDGLLKPFQEQFQTITDLAWVEARDSYMFRRDEIIECLKVVRNMSHESAAIWFDNAEQNHTNSPELFAKRVKQYLDSKPPYHRIIFLVDEMGQFIGSDGQQMLKLQTIVEDLGIHCGGRAWVVVTSQEDIDATIGDMQARQRNDFSKIQGRFKCRLSLSSSNTDEVIQSRILEKNAPAKLSLGDLFHKKQDILKHQLSFTSDCATLKNFQDLEDFTKNYPFVPFQYQVIQKIFETIRTTGISGAHLSRGERSMLDSFQIAAQKISDHEIGSLVPLYNFYSAIEGFLDTNIKSTIDQAGDNSSLKSNDISLLKTLFLIRHIDNLVKPNIDNLVTLNITEVDADRLQIKNSLQDSLLRLEKETLINRSGAHYYFLTNEERDIGRQIKTTETSLTEEIKLLSELIFDDTLNSSNKYKNSVNKKDYSYTRILDGLPTGKTDNELTVEMISPLSDDFSSTETDLLLRSTMDNGQIVIRLKVDEQFVRDLRTYKQTDKYINQKYGSSGSLSFKKILEQRGSENQARRVSLNQALSENIGNSDCFICGQSFSFKTSKATTCLSEALEYLISNAYPKLNYITKFHEDPQKEIKYILAGDKPTQDSFVSNYDSVNPNAVHEIETHIRLATGQNHAIAVADIVNKFSSRPFGWSDWEIIIIVARLFAAHRIRLIHSGEALSLLDAYNPLTKTPYWKQVSIQRIKEIEKADLEKAQKIGQTIFGKIGPDGANELTDFLKNHLADWNSKLEKYGIIAGTGKFPGKDEINNGSLLISRLIKIDDTYEFLTALNSSQQDLIDLEEDLLDLIDFYENQLTVWNNLIKKLAVYKQVQTELEAQFAPDSPIAELDEIFSSQRPYNKLKKVEPILEQLDAKYFEILELKKQEALLKIDNFIEQINTKILFVKATADISNKVLKPVQDLKKKLEIETIIPQIAYHIQEAESRFNEALDVLDEQIAEPDKPTMKTETMKISSLGLLSVLETEQDLKTFIESLHQKLLSKIQQKIKVRIS